MAQLSATKRPIGMTSCGPAGSRYRSMEDAGAHILRQHCSGFPKTNESTMIPTIGDTVYKEALRKRSNLSKKEDGQYSGMERNVRGELDEKIMADVLLKMIRQSDLSPAILVIRSFQVDQDNSKSLKRDALELEGIDLDDLDNAGLTLRGEHDFLILVKYLGIVFGEVKGSNSDGNITSAEKQLNEVNCFVQALYAHVNDQTRDKFPTYPLIITPRETSPSPTAPTSQGSYFVHKDRCDSFATYWLEAIDKLKSLKSANPFTDEEFDRIANIIVGVWSSNTKLSI